MNNQQKFELINEGRNFVLQIIRYDEPNNGRNLWLVDLYINGVLKNELFKNNGNYLNFNLDKYCFQSLNNDYIFITAETNSFVIETSSLNVYYQPIVLLSTLFFLGNVFTKNKLVIVYSNCLQIFISS